LISNTDQGSQFTSEAYLEAVESAGVDVSMDGRGRFIRGVCTWSDVRIVA
jgi:putative transposase